MKISEKLKHPFRRKTLTKEELALRAQADAASAQMSIERGTIENLTQADRYSPPPF
jgi:hypothetical protein